MYLGKTILFVHGLKAWRAEMSRILHEKGYRVVCAESYKKAIDEIFVEGLRPDLILAGMRQFNENATEMVQQIERQLSPAPPVILMTMMSADYDPGKFGVLYIWDSNSKPEKLLEEIERLLK